MEATSFKPPYQTECLELWEKPKVARDTFFIEDFTEHLNNRVRMDWDNIIMINGERGVGKSNCALELAGWLDKTHFTIDNICFLPDEILEKSSKLPKYSVIIIDEAGESYNYLDFMQLVQKALLKAMIGNRNLNLHWIWIAPLFPQVGSGIRNITNYHLSVFGRGACRISHLTRDTFRKFKEPFKKQELDWFFPKSKLYENYRKLKDESGKKRVSEYIDIIKSERGGYTLEWLRKQVEKDMDKYTGKKGAIDWGLMYVDFKKYKFSQVDCRAVARKIHYRLENEANND